MRIHLRFGMHRDVQLIHDEKEQIDGLVVPAHILSYQSASTSVFVTSLHDKPYVVDPMTFVYQEPKGAYSHKSGEIRLSLGRMFEAYNEELVERVEKLKPTERLTPEDFTAPDVLCERVANFQLEEVERASGSSGATKYLKRYAKTRIKQPRALVPPYFRFEEVDDAWYKLSLECAKQTSGIQAGIETAPVICCAASVLNDEGIRRIARDYGGFDRVFIWMDDYEQTSVSSPVIAMVRRLLQELRDAKVEIESLYGGYLLIMSAFDGMSAISHGILYTQHKPTTLVPGSGGAPERYYIPGLHEFRSLSQTDLILHKHPQLMCDCTTCLEELKGDPDRIIRFVDSPDQLRRHFLHCRRREADEIRNSSPEAEAARLRKAFHDYDDSIRALPNPDAFRSTSRMRGLDYLNQWADAFANE